MKTLLCAILIVLSCGLALGQQYKVLYTFEGVYAGDGGWPLSSLVLDRAGNLYGTTWVGRHCLFHRLRLRYGVRTLAWFRRHMDRDNPIRVLLGQFVSRRSGPQGRSDLRRSG
jgi:hypothetical protein